MVSEAPFGMYSTGLISSISSPKAGDQSAVDKVS